jgi:hypothetical protein
MNRPGYAWMVDAAHEAAAPGAVVVGPGGYAYATTERLRAADRWLCVGAASARPSPEPVAQPVTERLGVSCVRLGGGADAGAAVPPVFGRRMLDAHVELLAGVVEHAVVDLGGRTAQGSPLLGRQLVQAGIADAAMLVEEARGLLDGVVLDSGVRALVFRRLVCGGRALLRLLGGASFLADGPGGALMAAELVGTLYLTEAVAA